MIKTKKTFGWCLESCILGRIEVLMVQHQPYETSIRSTELTIVSYQSHEAFR